MNDRMRKSAIISIFVFCLTGIVGLLAAGPVVSGQSWKHAGDSLRALGQYEKAIEAYDKAPHSNSAQNVALPVIAQCYKSLGNYRKAIACYERQYELLEGINARQVSLDNVLLNLSGLWVITGELDKVVAALEVMEPGPGEAVRLVNLSSAYLRTGRPDKALSLLDSALVRSAPAIGVATGTADAAETEAATVTAMDKTYRVALQNKGYVLWAAERYEEAFATLSEVLPLYSVNEIERYICEGNLAIVEAETGRHDSALRHIDEAIAWVGEHRGQDDMDYIILVRKKAEILLKAGRRTEATEAFKDYFEREKNYILDNFLHMTEDERLNFWNTHSPLLAECYGTEDVDPDFLFDVALFSKSVLMQANLTLNSPGTSRDDDARNSPDDDARNAAIASRNEAAREDEALKAGLTTGVGQVRSKLGDGELAVEFIQYDKDGDTYYAALVTDKTGPARFVPLFSMSELTEHLQDSHIDPDHLYSVKGSLKGKIQGDTALGEMIWDRILDDGTRTVYFAADGVFHLIGVEYMHSGSPDCDIRRLSSTARLCDGPGRRDFSSVLLVGGLDYNDSSAVKPCNGHSPERFEFLTKTSYGTEEPPTFKNLPGSVSEIDSIAPIWAARTPKVLRSSAGTEDSVKVELPGRDLVLLSTHGFSMDYVVPPRSVFAKDSVSEDFSMSRSGLAMAGVNLCVKAGTGNEEIEDGILTAREISDLDLTAAGLVVLSACETGLGRVTLDGVVGLPRGFKKAGASTLLLSLWDVNDSATQILMTEFMRSLASGDGKHDALRKAQERVRSYEKTADGGGMTPSQQRRAANQGGVPARPVTPYADPQFWAAFILLDALD